MMMSATSPPRRVAYPIPEAAALLGMSRSGIYQLIDRGELRRVKIGRRSLIPASELDRLIDPDREATEE